MKRRFDGVARNWLPRWWTARSTEFGCRVAADHGRKKFRASKLCRGVRGPVSAGGEGSGCSEVPIHGSHTCAAHTQLVAIAGRASTQVRRLWWPALVRLLAAALDPDPRWLGAPETADPSVLYLQLCAVRSALPSRRGGRLCVASWRDWP